MKENGHNDLDRLLKEQLGDRQAGVPELVWEKIEERIYPEKKRRGLFWWWIFGAGMLAAGVWLAIWMGNGKDLRAGGQEAGHSAAVSSGTIRDIPKSKKRENGNAASAESPDSEGDQREAPHANRNLIIRDIPNSRDVQNVQRGSDEKSMNPSLLVQNPRTNEILPRKTANLREDKVIARRFQLLLPSEKSSSDTPLIDPLSPRVALHGNTDTIFRRLQLQPLSRFTILAYGGPSFYDMATLRPYFETGRLSHRTFDASGFEAGLGASFRITERFSVYALGSFNRKQASHRYTLAITEEDYFSNVLEGEQLPLENIDDNGNNCFLAKDATATYTVSTWSAAIGANFTVLRLGQWSVDADLRFSVNAASDLNVKETTVIALSDPEKEHFSWYQPGAGLAVHYQLNKRLSVGIAPLYSRRFHPNASSFSKKLNELIVPVTLRIGI